VSSPAAIPSSQLLPITTAANTQFEQRTIQPTFNPANVQFSQRSMPKALNSADDHFDG
jgi:hypothetical protein